MEEWQGSGGTCGTGDITAALFGKYYLPQMLMGLTEIEQTQMEINR